MRFVYVLKQPLRPTEHDGLKEDGTEDKRVSSEHGFGGDRERASEGMSSLALCLRILLTPNLAGQKGGKIGKL